MQNHVPRRKRAMALSAVVVLVVALAGLLSACGSSGNSSSNSSSGSSSSGSSSSGSSSSGSTGNATISASEKSTLLKKAFYTDQVTADPEVLGALKIANTPLTSAQEAKVRDCMKNTTCDTGQGTLTLGIADSFGDIPWRVQARLEQTAQAIQGGQVKQIIYTNGHADLQKSEANFRALMAQHVDIISAYYDFASAMTSLFRQAQSKGIIVTSYISPIPHGDGAKDAIQFSENYAEVGKAMADAVKQAHPTAGNAAFFTGTPGNPTGAAWQPAAQQDLEAAGWKVIFKGNTSWTPAGELAGASAVIAKGQPVDGLLYDGAGPENLIKGFQRAGKKVPAIASFSPGNTYFSLWKSIGGPKDQYVTDAQTWTGRVAVQAAIDRAKGKTVPGDIVLPQPLVQTSVAQQVWGPTLSAGPAYLPPTFASPSLIAEFNK
jgi:ABC-type sugar transport system substrate-binding protein